MRIKQVVISLMVIVLLSIPLTGCWNKEAWGIRGDEFQKTFIRYSSNVRWAEYNNAYAYIKMREGEPRPLDLDTLEEFEVTRYEAVQKTPGTMVKGSPVEMEIVVEIDFLRDSSPSIKNIKRKEIWWLDQESEKWYLDGNLPDFSQKQ